VTADDGPGTLREACRAAEPLWIVFEVFGTIHLQSYLRVSSHKTVDGRGQRVVLTGKGLQLKSCHHVIVCNLMFEGGRGHDVDGIQIKPGSTNIWTVETRPNDAHMLRFWCQYWCVSLLLPPSPPVANRHLPLFSIPSPVVVGLSASVLPSPPIDRSWLRCFPFCTCAMQRSMWREIQFRYYLDGWLG
jgi:hypothetical protein